MTNTITYQVPMVKNVHDRGLYAVLEICKIHNHTSIGIHLALDGNFHYEKKERVNVGWHWGSSITFVGKEPL